jgi:hypothetical protein
MKMRQILPFALLLAPVACAQQTPKVLMATGKEEMAQLLDPGSLDCVGGKPTGTPLQCTPGTTKVFLWNWVSTQRSQDVVGTAAALIGGQNKLVMNCNLDQTYYGHCWGIFEWEIPGAGGKWEGVWSGVSEYATNRVTYHLTGYGTGGQLEGLQIEKEGVWPGGTQLGTFVVKVTKK